VSDERTRTRAKKNRVYQKKKKCPQEKRSFPSAKSARCRGRGARCFSRALARIWVGRGVERADAPQTSVGDAQGETLERLLLVAREVLLSRRLRGAFALRWLRGGPRLLLEKPQLSGARVAQQTRERGVLLRIGQRLRVLRVPEDAPQLGQRATCSGRGEVEGERAWSGS